MARKHVHITLDPELYARARAVVDRIPGVSVSAIIEDFLAETVPYLENVVEAAESGDQEAIRAVLSGMIGDKIVHMLAGEGVDAT